jgi:hypothetical protein
MSLHEVVCTPQDVLGWRDLLIDRNQDIEFRHLPLAAGSGDQFKRGDGGDPESRAEALQVVDSYSRTAREIHHDFGAFDK